MQSKISRLPAYLTVNFVRFQYKGKEGINAKILKDIKFPIDFDAFELCSKTLQEKLTPMRLKFKVNNIFRLWRMNLEHEQIFIRNIFRRKLKMQLYRIRSPRTSNRTIRKMRIKQSLCHSHSRTMLAATTVAITHSMLFWHIKVAQVHRDITLVGYVNHLPRTNGSNSTMMPCHRSHPKKSCAWAEAATGTVHMFCSMGHAFCVYQLLMSRCKNSALRKIEYKHY